MVFKVLYWNRSTFLKKKDLSSPGYGLKFDFLKEENGGRISGLYTETGLFAILEPADFESIDMVSSFFGAIVNRKYGIVNNTQAGKVLTKYVDLLRAIYRRELNKDRRSTNCRASNIASKNSRTAPEVILKATRFLALKLPKGNSLKILYVH